MPVVKKNFWREHNESFATALQLDAELHESVHEHDNLSPLHDSSINVTLATRYVPPSVHPVSKSKPVYKLGITFDGNPKNVLSFIEKVEEVAKAHHIPKVDLFESSSKLGVVEPLHIPWNSPVLLVKKSSGEYRFCFDGRKLNDITKHDSYALPRIDRILNQLRDAQFISSVDLRKAFWQVPLDEASKEKTAFSVPGRGLFQFSVMPFGVRNAAQTQARQCEALFGPRFEPHVFTYLDDIFITSSTFEKHVALLYEIKNILKEANCLALPAKRS
ncbi:hypothetical protein JTB14_032419 [Gonioctena quinquepunctata]|nr:hypothetical protein JTB14_032419 [Gonioctena quinquepunctata]